MSGDFAPQNLLFHEFAYHSVYKPSIGLSFYEGHQVFHDTSFVLRFRLFDAKLLQDTCRQQGMTVIVITHNTAIAPMADKVIHVKNGQVDRIDRNPSPTPVEEIEW